MNKQQLASKIWAAANKMRSNIDADKYKDIILGFIFYKFLSNKEESFFTNEGMTNEDMKECLVEKDEDTVKYAQKNLGYFIAYNHLFSTWIKDEENNFSVAIVKDALSAFSRLINKSHEKVFKGIFNTLDTSISNLGSTDLDRTKAISDLLFLINDIPMNEKQNYDVLGFVYEYLISNFAANSGKKAGEFYTPHEVSLLMSEIVAEHLKDKDKIENIFLNFAIPIGLMYAIFMMPTYTPDAGAHIWKAYELSEGIFITKINDEGESLTTVPKALTSYGESILTKYSVLNESKNDELVTDYNTTVDVNTPAKGYFSLFYVIYAVAFLISRTLSLNMIIGLFLARILNYILVLVLGYISIKKIPFGKILLAVYLMIPMMLQQATAISVDSLMNAIIIFFISYILSLMFNNENLKKKEI